MSKTLRRRVVAYLSNDTMEKAIALCRRSGLGMSAMLCASIDILSSIAEGERGDYPEDSLTEEVEREFAELSDWEAPKYSQRTKRIPNHARMD